MATTPLAIFDADDTLWESALFFEQAEASFLELAGRIGHSLEEVGQLVRSRDLARLSVTGYGAVPYLDTLYHVLAELSGPDVPASVTAEMDAISDALLGHPVRLFPDVLPLLQLLRESSFSMVICTMGQPEHQHSKFDRSGLSAYFEECVVVPLKTGEILSSIAEDRAIPLSRAVMIGNSPRSDINPALDAGLHAVHIRRDRTWAAEHQQFLDPARVHSVEALAEIPPLLQRLGLLSLS